MSSIYLKKSEKPFLKYPGREDYFSPNVKYPEYQWGESLSDKENIVYDLIREVFFMAGYDRENYGLSKWNPLGEFIKKGDTVLIKPNWVENKNKNEQVHDNLACLVTNPSVVRAIIDYVLIALQGTGKIVVGDAPMQGCDLEDLFHIAGYDRLFRFYEEQGIKIEVQDFRKYSKKSIANGVLSSPVLTPNSSGSLEVDLGGCSMHAEKDANHPVYKVTDYTKEMTASYHSDGKHIYEVNKTPLQADVIINVPKPKTHRLAGMTAAVKNFVGITYEKASLPHRIEGDKEHGGDAYLKKSFWKEKKHYFDEKRTRYSMEGKYSKSKINDIFMKACYVIGAAASRDKYRIGSWYGNDTIWRTSVDLNYILLYADKNGKIQEKQQRSVLTIGDMLICGQKDGPVSPVPKTLGMVMMSDNPLLFDWCMCEIMNFDHNKMAIFNHKMTYKRFGYFSKEEFLEEKLRYKAHEKMKTVKIADFSSEKEWAFEPHTCWKGNIEK